MKISITFRELLDKGVWQEYCKLKGCNEWMIAEGLASENEIIDLSLEECKQIGLEISKNDE